MSRSSVLPRRLAALALAGSACLAAGITSAQAAAAAEVRTFTGSGMGTGPSQAVDGAVRMAYTSAQWAGWQATQCYVRGTDVRWSGPNVYTAVAELFCRR
ncbi:hypothetical protein [Streptomyces yangpuensis]|uniref:hypothetical protein n=1 Tax=Streptomyces yangpuensis TaxID=1648182 RepID=UPI00370FEFEE